jgi:hypothetical protein
MTNTTKTTMIATDRQLRVRRRRRHHHHRRHRRHRRRRREVGIGTAAVAARCTFVGYRPSETSTSIGTGRVVFDPPPAYVGNKRMLLTFPPAINEKFD